MIELNQSWAGPYHRMPLELPKDRAAMIAKAIEADDGACSTGAMMADPAPVAAKPLLDELAEVVRKASNELTHDARFFHNMALSVARRLLEREPSKQLIDDCYSAWMADSGGNRQGVRAVLKRNNRSQLAALEEKA